MVTGRGKWNAREHLSHLAALEAELNSPETRRMVAEENERAKPMNVLRREHGEDWLDEEQADWEEGADDDV